MRRGIVRRCWPCYADFKLLYIHTYMWETISCWWFEIFQPTNQKLQTLYIEVGIARPTSPCLIPGTRTAFLWIRRSILPTMKAGAVLSSPSVFRLVSTRCVNLTAKQRLASFRKRSLHFHLTQLERLTKGLIEKLLPQSTSQTQLCFGSLLRKIALENVQ